MFGEKPRVQGKAAASFLQSAVTQPASRFSNRVSPIQYWDWLPQSNDQWVNDRSDFTAFTFPTEPEAREWRGSTLPQMCITSEQSKRKISGIFDQLCNQHIWFFSCFINHLCWEHLGQRIVVQLLSQVWLFETPWTATCHTSLSFTISHSLLKLVSIESVMPSNHLILYCPLLLLPPIPPSIRVFPNELALHIRWPKYWSFNFRIRPSNEYSGLISFRIS